MKSPISKTDSGSAAELSIETLLVHESWLRRIVVELVDEHEAEDLLQETWAVAMRTGPTRLLAPRAWLRRVARNLAHRHRRGAVRRRQRETFAAKDECVPSTDAMVDRLHAHRRVAQAVADLEEPYRTAVLLRFFEELPPREIARRLHLRGSTVRTQIDRGLRMLRGRLERFDVRGLAAVVLSPRFGEPALPIGSTLVGDAVDGGVSTSAGSSSVSMMIVGVLSMAARNKVATAALLVLFLSTGAWIATANSTALPSTDPATVQRAGPERIGPASTDDPLTDSPRDAARQPLKDRSKTREAVVAPSPDTTIRGRVLDRRGQPIIGVPVSFAPSRTSMRVFGIFGMKVGPDSLPTEMVGTTDQLGGFAFDCQHEFGQVFVGEDYVTILTHTPSKSKRADGEALIIAAPRTGARGRVVNWLGLPIAGVSVVARIDGLSDIELPIDHLNQVELPSTVTDRKGEFALEDLPLLPELELEFTKADYRVERRHEIGRDADLRVKLRGFGKDVWRVSGTVVDQAGRLVPGATVFLHQTLQKTGPFGEFSIETKFLEEGSLFLAGLPGVQVAARPDVVAKLVQAGAERRVTGVVLELGGPAPGISGRVVDADGKPIRGLVIALLDARGVGGVNTVEDFVAGRPSELTKVGKGMAKIDARTDAAGRFAIVGLESRDYRLRVFDGESLRSTTVTVTPGRQDILVQFPPRSARTIRGTVRDRRGKPLVGIRVAWGLETYSCGGFRMFSPGGSTETDLDGRFAMEGLPDGDVELSLSGSSIIDLTHPLLGVPDEADIRIETWARCRFRVEVQDLTVDRIRVLDTDGGALELKRRNGQVSYSGDSWTVKRGKTPVLEVSEAACTLVLLRKSAEVARHTLDFSTETVNIVQR